jgi:hypothetical protein
VVKKGEDMLKRLINARPLRMALLVGVIAMVGAVGSAPAGAEDKLLSRSGLKRLIVSAKTAADHERLAAHFDAKAAQLERDAKDHDELAEDYKRNPPVSRRVEKSQSSEHCRDLAKDYAKVAQDARRLAADHRELAKEAR